MSSKFTLILGLSIIFTIFSRIGAEKLKMVLDRLEKVKDAENILNTKLTFDKDGDSNNIVINGFLETSADIDDEYRLSFDILHSTEEDGEKKLVIRLADRGVCEIMQNQYKNYFYESLKEQINAPDPDECPVAKNKFELNKYPFDSSKFAHYLRRGFYHIVITLRHNDEDVLQYRVEGHTEDQ